MSVPGYLNKPSKFQVQIDVKTKNRKHTETVQISIYTTWVKHWTPVINIQKLKFELKC